MEERHVGKLKISEKENTDKITSITKENPGIMYWDNLKVFPQNHHIEANAAVVQASQVTPPAASRTDIGIYVVLLLKA